MSDSKDTVTMMYQVGLESNRSDRTELAPIAPDWPRVAPVGPNFVININH